MSTPDERRARRALAGHSDEETRYRAVARLDAADPDDRGVLIERLADPSWRVRSAAVDGLSGPGGDAALAPLLAILEEGPSVGARDAAASVLGRIGAPAVPALVERLHAGDPDLRHAAASVLGGIADRRALAPLTARLADPDPNVRAAAAEALGKIGGAEAVQALRAAVGSDDPTLRLTALEALAQLRARVPRAEMERILADRTLRRAAYRLLGACEDAEALPLLVRGLRERSRSAREAALAALGQQRARRSPRELVPLLEEARAAADRDPGLADAWAASLSSEEPFVGVGALAALGAAGSPRHVPAMLQLAEDERYRALVEEILDGLAGDATLRDALAGALPSLGQLARLTALAALARLGSPAAFESLVREASDPDAYDQAEAIAALGRLRDARGIAPLAGLLADDAPAAAGLASTALARIGRSDPEGRRAVLAALRDRAGASPSAALYRALGEIGGPEDLDLVRGGLRSEIATHRAAAAAAAGSLARRGLSGRLLGELGAAVSDPAPPVRVAALRALGDLARAGSAAGGSAPRAGEPLLGRDAMAALRAALGDPEPAVRAAGAEALGACGVAEDAGAIAALVTAPGVTPPVAVAALHALSALGAVPRDAAAREAVTRAARHGDPEVVKEAVLAAARLPGSGGEHLLLEAAASPRWDVRQAAARAMAERGAPALAAAAERLAAAEPDPLVARAFADAARALGGG